MLKSLGAAKKRDPLVRLEAVLNYGQSISLFTQINLLLLLVSAPPPPPPRVVLLLKGRPTSTRTLNRSGWNFHDMNLLDAARAWLCAAPSRYGEQGGRGWVGGQSRRAPPPELGHKKKAFFCAKKGPKKEGLLFGLFSRLLLCERVRRKSPRRATNLLRGR